MINLHIPVNSLGFGLFSLAYYKIFTETGTDVRVCPINEVPRGSVDGLLEDLEIDKDKFYNSIGEPNKDDTTVTIWHPHEIARLQTARTIGYTHFEIDDLSLDAAKQIMKLDNIVVCYQDAVNVIRSSYAKYAAEASLADTKITTVHLIEGPCVPLMLKKPINTLKEVRELALSLSKGQTIFGSSGKWEVRKNHPMIIDSIDALKLPITLVALWNNVFTGGLAEPIQYLTNHGWQIDQQFTLRGGLGYVFKNKHGAHVILVPPIERYRDVLSLYRTFDVYLAISSGEGWDMPLAECIGLGVTAIISKNTAHNVYIQASSSWDISPFVIPCERVLAYDGRWFKGEGCWFKPKENIFMTKLAIMHTSKHDSHMRGPNFTSTLDLCKKEKLAARFKEVFDGLPDNAVTT